MVIAASRPVQVDRQAGSLGAYILGLDLSRPPEKPVFDLVQAAILEHHVVCIRGQDISPAQHLAFAKHWGELFANPSVRGMPGFPEMVEVFGPNKTTESWHSDLTHSRRPPRLSFLLARRIPPYGNDTQFANQHAAYEALSAGMKKMLGPLRAVHRTHEPRGNPAYEYTGYVGEATHPVVRRHPETGRKALFVNTQYTRHFEDMTEEESRSLLEFLYAHCSRAEFTWRHRWRAGDLLIWDNASVQHAVVNDLRDTGNRLLNRVTTMGDEPA